MLTPEDRLTFDLFFASVTSMQFHPGAGTKEHRRLSIEECKDVALEMLAVRQQMMEGE